jgi:hypothetical protein
VYIRAFPSTFARFLKVVKIQGGNSLAIFFLTWLAVRSLLIAKPTHFNDINETKTATNVILSIVAFWGFH